MKTLTVREARAALGHLDELLAKEGEILVTRRGKPVARLLPMRSLTGRFPNNADLRGRMPLQVPPSEVLIREDRGPALAMKPMLDTSVLAKLYLREQDSDELNSCLPRATLDMNEAHGAKPMKTLTIREARAALGHLDELLAKEGEILVTRRGKPVARLLPMPSREGRFPDHQDLRARMRQVETPSEVLVREERDLRG